MSNPNTLKPAEIAQRTEATAIEKFQGPIDGITSPCGTWIKVKANYADRWQTPMAGAKFNLYVEDKLLLEGKHLKDYEQVGLITGEGPPQNPQEVGPWYKKYQELGTFNHPSCEQGKARFELVKASASEEAQIEAINKAIAARLDGEYRNLVKQMLPYNREWDKSGPRSILKALEKADQEASEEWLKDQEELLTWKYWQDIGSTIAEYTPKLYDTAKSMGQEYIDDLIDDIEKVRANRENMKRPQWWLTKADEYIDEQNKKLKGAQEYVKEVAQDINESAQSALEIYQRREAILALPNLFVAGKVDEIEAFIDIDLYAIDPQLATELKYDKSWQEFLELAHDGEALTSITVYGDLIIKLIPPNFYFYYYGKGAFYIIIELLFLFVCLMFGGAAAARVTSMSARLVSVTAKGGKAIEGSQDALRAYNRTIEAFTKVAEDLNKLREKLITSRRARSINGSSGTTLAQKRKTTERDGRCRVCDNKDHQTPLHRGGNVEYRA